MSPGRLTPEIELSVPGPFSIDEPALTPFPLTPVHSRPPISSIPHSEFPSPSPPLIPPKRSSVKIEEVKDVENEDVEMLSSSPPPPEAGLSQYTPSQVPTIIPQKHSSNS